MVFAILLAAFGGSAVSDAKPWCTELSVQDRFLPVFGGVAYLDKTTGLVWEKLKLSQTIGVSSGDQYPQYHAENIQTAQFACLNSTLGGVGGWRLPTAAEFGTLLDSSHNLVSGNPFLHGVYCDLGGFETTYWTSTRAASDSSYLQFSPSSCGDSGAEGFGFFSTLPSTKAGFWCVRAQDANN